jgi:hypothetical protein
MISSERFQYYLLFFGIAVVSGYIANKFKKDYDKSNDYEIIKKYLLNDSPLYGYNRPKIWIHSKYEINARKWKDFQSRNSTDLNQPYIHQTIKTIINHCGNDFNICLIDDESFSKLLPSWDIHLSKMAEPMKTQFRELGMMELLYYYGGMIVPNSFLCMKNMKDFFISGLEGDKPFVCENVCKNLNQFKQKRKMLFCPDTFFMGSHKNDSTILLLIEFLKKRNNSHFTREREFTGDTSCACMELIEKQEMNLISGQKIGVKNSKRKPILIEDLMEENYLDLTNDVVGIYIPAEEILNRPKFQWFAVMSAEEIFKTRLIVAKYLKASIMDSTDEYKQSTEIRSVVSI